jgi:hypothetical protein
MKVGIRHGLVMTGLLAGCASSVVATVKPAREIVLAYDDARATGTLAFPSATYESVIRFQIPDGAHKPLRLRFQAEAPGQVEIAIDESTVLETPGEALVKLTRDVAQEDLSNGKDGRWIVEDLVGMKPLTGVVWVGVHKIGGTPTIWACGVVSGQSYIRNNDPQNPMGLLPTKRTPMVRLELAPLAP